MYHLLLLWRLHCMADTWGLLFCPASVHLSVTLLNFQITFSIQRMDWNFTLTNIYINICDGYTKGWLSKCIFIHGLLLSLSITLAFLSHFQIANNLILTISDCNLIHTLSNICERCTQKGDIPNFNFYSFCPFSVKIYIFCQTRNQQATRHSQGER